MSADQPALKKGLIVPLGPRNTGGVRPTFVMEVLDPLLASIQWPAGFPAWVAGFQLQDKEPLTPDGWAKPYMEWARDNDGAIILHWDVNSVKAEIAKAALSDGKLTDILQGWAQATKKLHEEGLIQRAVFHHAALIQQEPTGWDDQQALCRRPRSAGEIIRFMKGRAEVLARLVEICGDILDREMLDVTQFRDRSKLPRWFEGQFGTVEEALWENQYVGNLCGLSPGIAMSEEHVAMTFNFLYHCGDWEGLTKPPSQILTEEEKELAAMTGVWYRQGEIPTARDFTRFSTEAAAEVFRLDHIKSAYARLQPRSAQLGASLTATTRGGRMLGTHQPFNPMSPAQMELLAWELRWAIEHPELEIIADATLGAGLKYGPQFGPRDREYSEWGPENRPVWDEAVKLFDPLIIANELYAIAQGLTNSK